MRTVNRTANSRDQVLKALENPNSCTASTCEELRGLLGLRNGVPNKSQQRVDGSKQDKPPQAPSQARTASKPSTTYAVKPVSGNSGPAVAEANGDSTLQLTTREKKALATEVVNAALSSLTRLSRPPASTPSSRTNDDDTGTGASSSTKQRECLHERSVNLPSPRAKADRGKAPSSGRDQQIKQDTIEQVSRCCGDALIFLNSDNSSSSNSQLEQGWLALVSKLIALRQPLLAAKGLKSLKQRLIRAHSVTIPSMAENVQEKALDHTHLEGRETLITLLQVTTTTNDGATLSLVVSYQMLVLQAIAITRKPALFKALLLVLDARSASSPVSIIKRLHTVEGHAQQAEKQLEALSKLLLILCPGLSRSEDQVAGEEGKSIKPETAFHLQALALEARAMRMQLAECKASVDDELLTPLQKCLVAYLRRSSEGPAEVFTCISNAAESLIDQASSSTSDRPGTVLSAIIETIASVAEDAGLHADALRWTEKIPRGGSEGGDMGNSTIVLAFRRATAVLKRGTLDKPADSMSQLEDARLKLQSLDCLDIANISLLRAIVDLQAVILQQLMAATSVNSRTSDSDVRRFDACCTSCIDSCLSLLTAVLSQGGKGCPGHLPSASRDLLLQASQRAFDFSIRAALAFSKGHSGDALSFEDQLNRLQRCEVICPYLESESPRQQAPTRRVLLSNAYIGLYLSSKDTLIDMSILFLERSCATLSEATSTEKTNSGLAARLVTLAKALKEKGRWQGAHAAWRQLIDVLLKTAALEDDVRLTLANASGRSPSQQYRLMESALANLLESSNNKSASYLGKEGFFDDSTFASSDRWLLLECQLRIAMGWFGSNTLRSHALELMSGITNRLLDDLRDAGGRHRIVRVLVCCLKSFSQQYGQSQPAYISRLKDEASRLSEICRADELKFNPVERHLYATMLVLLGILESPTSNDTFNGALREWHCTLEHFTNAAIDDSDIDKEWWLDLLVHASERLQSCGKGHLCLAFLQLRLRIADLTGIDNVPALVDLATQHEDLDQTQEAGLCLERARKLMDPTLGPAVASSFWLACAKYHLDLGLRDQAGRDLQEAWTALQIKGGSVKTAGSQQPAVERLRRVCNVAKYHQLCAELASANGMHAEAVRCAYLQVAALQRAWRGLQSLISSPSGVAKERKEDETTVVTLKYPTIDLSQPVSQKDEKGPKKEPSAGLSRMIEIVLPRVLAACNYLAELQAHSGLFRDAAFTLDQCQRTILGLDLSRSYPGPSIRKGDLLVRSGCLAEGALELQGLESESSEVSSDMVLRQRCLGHYFHVQRHWKPELEAYERGQEMIMRLAGEASIIPYQVQEGSAPPPSSKRTRKPASAVVKSRAPRKRSKAKPSEARPGSRGAHDQMTQTPHSASKAMLLCLEAESYLVQHDVRSCEDVLDKIPQPSKDSSIFAMVVALRVQYLLEDALLEMGSDSILAMLPESTISIPAASCPGEVALEESLSALHIGSGRQKALKHSRPATKRIAPSTKVAMRLREICETSREHQSLFVRHLTLTTLIKLRSAVVSASMLLAYVDAGVHESYLRPAYISFWLDLPRSVAAYREGANLLGERLGKLCPAIEEHRLNSEVASGTLQTLSAYHSELLELLPKSWMVISLALDAEAKHLLLTRSASGRQPLIIRLPLARQSEDVDEEQVFSFSDAQSELRDIIAQSDSTVHSARDNPEQLKAAGARTQWWSNREALNERLKDMLQNIENMWLGGFRSLFSQQEEAPDVLSRFQQTFENILDKHLPSRQTSGQRTSKVHLKLDRHVLELFTGLTERMTPDTDLEEPLTDLLYYVVDILQFHGEPNAYDEIDFDAIIVEVQAALEAYRQAAESALEQDAERHTILVLDKELHIFPWESMPCLQNKSVSRVHSLYDLHERLVAMRGQAKGTADKSGMYVSSNKGSYILNPGCDLQQTQLRFEEPLSSLSSSSGWSSIVGREPEEAQMLAGLDKSNGSAQSEEPQNRIFLYIGHGSGEQYVRHRKIRGLRYAHLTSSDLNQRTTVSSSAPDAASSDDPKSSTNTMHEPAVNPNVSAALLFGCSSASLRLYSEYEPHGTPKSYMAAGAPALLGSLWDVTDGDVDRFAGAVLERWGLFDKGTFEAHEAKMAQGKKKTKAKKPPKVESDAAEKKRFGSMSLSEAVGRSRSSCYLNYLNGAAMVVYGVPVYLDKRA